MTAPEVENRDILLRLLSACNIFSGKDASSLCCVVQYCSNKLNPSVWISLRARKRNYELAECKPVVGNHSFNFNPKELFQIYSVHFTSDCFENTFHIEGTSMRLNWKSVEGTFGQLSSISAICRCRASKQSLTFLKLWLLRGFSIRVTLTRSQRRANKHLIFASFFLGRLRVQRFLVRAIYWIYNVFKFHDYKPRVVENSISAEMKRPIILIVCNWFISRHVQFKTFL